MAGEVLTIFDALYVSELDNGHKHMQEFKWLSEEGHWYP